MPFLRFRSSTSSRHRAAFLLLVFLLTGCATNERLNYEAQRSLAIDLMNEGEALEEAGQYSRARDKYLQSVELYESARIVYLLGHVNRLMGDNTRALWYFDRALEMAPGYGLAEAERELVRLELAGTEIESRGGDPVPSGEEDRGKAPEGPVEVRQGPVQGAPAGQGPIPSEVRRAVFPELYGEGQEVEEIRQSAAAATRQGDWHDASRLWNQVVRQNPGDAQSRMELATALENTSRSRRALQEYRAAAELEPENAEILVRWGNAAAKIGSAQEAERLYRRASEMAPQDPRPGTNLGALYYQQGSYGRSLEQLKGVVGQHPDFAPARLNLALVLDAADAPESEVIDQLTAYLDLGGARDGEARSWMESLERRREREKAGVH
jgi:Flp pilus assembly protein TadD